MMVRVAVFQSYHIYIYYSLGGVAAAILLFHQVSPTAVSDCTVVEKSSEAHQMVFSTDCDSLFGREWQSCSMQFST